MKSLIIFLTLLTFTFISKFFPKTKAICIICLMTLLSSNALYGAINVRERPYRARGNGIANDFSAIQAAINAAPTPGAVYLPAGTYRIDRTLIMKPFLSLYGDGIGATVLEMASGCQAVLKYFAPDYSRDNIEVSKMTIRSAPNAVNVTGIYTKLSSANLYHDLAFKGVRYTLHIDTGLFQFLSNIMVEQYGDNNCGELLIESTIGQYSQHININGYITAHAHTGPEAIRLSRATNVTMTGISIYAAGTCVDGIVIEDDSQGISITNSQIIATQNGILTRERSGNTPGWIDIIGVHVDQARVFGVNLQQGFRINIIGGQYTFGGQGINIGTDQTRIIGTTVDGMSANGIVVMSNVSNFIISNNMVVNNNYCGIVVSAGTGDYFIISGNRSINNTNGNFSDSATGLHKRVSLDNLW